MIIKAVSGWVDKKYRDSSSSVERLVDIEKVESSTLSCPTKLSYFSSEIQVNNLL